MKNCGYCGKENVDDAPNCIECCSRLAAPAPGAEPGGLTHRHSRTLTPQIGLPLKTGGGVVLILTALIVVIARLVFDIMEILHGGKIGKPGSYAVGMLALYFIMPILLFVLPALTAACVVRCKSALVGILVMVLSLAVVVFAARPLKIFFPVFLLGAATGSSLGCYIGGAIHFALGAWLFGWLEPCLNRLTASTSAKSAAKP